MPAPPSSLITPIDGEADDWFGSSVATSADGRTVVVGGPASDIGNSANQGSARVLFWNGVEWEQRGGALTASDGGPFDAFGSSVAISADGGVVVIGSSDDTVGGVANQGSVRVLVFDGANWVERGGIVTPVGGAAGDVFGRSVTVSADGNTVIVGSILDDVGAGTDQGSVRVFTWNGAAWEQRGGVLAPADGANGDWFGESVATSADGNTIIVGAPLDDLGGNVNQGSVRVFTWNGAAWEQRGGLLTAADGMTGDGFGISVAASSDGNTVVVGAFADDVGGNLDQGSARVFDWNGSEWVQRGGTLIASDGASYDAFGRSVAVSADGNSVVVGAPWNDDELHGDTGSAYVFVWNGSAWQQRGASLVPDDAEGGETFGSSVAVSSDGNTVIVGGPLDDVGANIDQGSARVFNWNGTAWVEGIAPATLTIAALSADKAEGDTGATAFTFTVTRMGDLTGALQVDYHVAGVDASSVDIASPLFGFLLFADGEATQTITVEVTGDTEVEGDESFTVTLANAIGATLGDTTTATGTIRNDDAEFTIAALSADKAEGDSGGTGFTFTVTRTGSLAGSASVGFVVSGMTASLGVDIAGPDFGIISFADGQATQTLTVNVIGDTQVESDETFTVSLFDVGDATLGAITEATGIIRNDDVFVPAPGSLIAPDGAEADNFGWSVASSANGRVIVVGGWGDDVGANENQGSARVFAWNGTEWVQRGEALTPLDGEAGDWFGMSVAISADGNTVIVGGDGDDVGGNLSQGSARVFVWDGTEWQQRGGPVIASDGAMGDLFGRSVTMSEDGNTIAVSAWNDDVGPDGVKGSVHVFVWNGSGWEQRGATLIDPSGEAYSSFAASVALSADGTTLVVGASADDVGGNEDQGAAYVFTWNGTAWVQRGAPVTPSDGEFGDQFGRSVAVSDDGNTIVLGGYADMVGGNPAQGSARVFVWNGTGWEQRGGALTPSDGEAFDFFGISVASSADGNTVVVGGLGDFINGHASQGSARVFVWNGTEWEQRGEALTASDGWFGDNFGFSVAMSDDGETVVIGGPYDDVGLNTDQGSARVFTWDGTAWVTEVNDDAEFSITANSASADEGDSGTTAFTFTVTRVGSTVGTASVDWSVFPEAGISGADFQGGALPSGTVTFADGEATRTITIQVAGDTLVEANEALTVTLSNPVGATLGVVVSDTSIIRNDDVAVPGITLVGLNWWGDNHLVGTEGPDHLTAPGWRNSVRALGGDDTIYGGLGNSFVDAGAGNDKVDVEGWGNTVFGGSGHDTIYAGQGNSFVDAGTGNDKVDVLGYGNTVLAGGGNDTVYGGQGNSFVDAGDGDDKVDIDGHGNSIFAGAGNDTVFAGAGNSLVDAGEGDDKVDVLGNGNSVFAGAGDDTIYAGTGNSFVDAGAGDDEVNVDGFGNSILAGAGHDTVYAGQGGAYVEGGEGDDRLTADGFGNTLLGGAGADVLFGGAGGANLSGGEGNDTLMATGWSNIFVGGAGDDVIQGGDGGEQFWLNAPGAGVDRVMGFDALWGDRLVLQGVLAEQVTAAADGADLALAVNGQRVALLVGLGGLSLTDLTGQGALVFG